MKKTVLHIAEASGGVERYLIALLSKMKKYEDFQHILVCSSSYDKKKFYGLVESVVVIADMHNAISVIHDFKAMLAVRRVIKIYKPSIIYCHSSKAGAIGRLANLGFKNKLIYNAHGWSFNIKNISKNKTFFYELVEKLLALLCDKIVCISEFEKQSALDHKICNRKKLVVINNGIDFDEVSCIQPFSKKSLGIPNNTFVVGSIGRLSPQKAPDVFVKMAAIVKKKIDNSFFIMVGDDIANGSCRRETELLIKELGLEDSFLITGWIDSPLYYASLFDVAVLLSRWEGFGLVLAEYMYMQKPIVATKVDAIPYVVGDAGLLVDIDDYKNAAEAVFSIYESSTISNYLIEKGKERVKQFDSQRTADEHKNLFKRLIPDFVSTAHGL